MLRAFMGRSRASVCKRCYCSREEGENTVIASVCSFSSSFFQVLFHFPFHFSLSCPRSGALFKHIPQLGNWGFFWESVRLGAWEF